MMRHDKNMFISYDINILYGFHYVYIYMYVYMYICIYVYMVFLWPTQVETEDPPSFDLGPHGELEILFSDHPESFNSNYPLVKHGWLVNPM